ncbi:MAG: VCBS repeat-containing protein [Bryobacteraceae bacterium]|nr:VCBS repeat-containing protein [Bryobacteraceae bacterium]
MAQWLPAFLVLLPALLFLQPLPSDPKAIALDRHRNLGKAFYENPTTQKEAVEEFRKALALAPDSTRERLNFALALLQAGSTDQALEELLRVQKLDPKLPYTWFNLAIAYKKAGETEKALAQMEQFVTLIPNEPISHYNLGALYKLAGRPEDAMREFQRASTLDPALAAAHFQLYNAYRTSSRPEDAKRELATFQALKKQQEGAAIPEDVEWNAWAEILDVMQDRPAEMARLKPVWEVRRLPGKALGAMFLDPLGDGIIRALTWTADRLALEGVGPIGAGLRNITSVSAADFTNDGLPDLCVLTESGPVLLTNAKGGKFTRASASLPALAFAAAVWMDYDHDYDLDLFLLGEKSMLFRNAGTAGFQDRTPDFPFLQAPAVAGVVTRAMPDTKGFDLAVSYLERDGVLYRDKLQGKYEVEGIALPARASALRSADADNDGHFDLVFVSEGSAWKLPNRAGAFLQPFRFGASATSLLADTDNRGLSEIASPENLQNPGCLATDVADVNGDGANDLLCRSEDSAHLLINRTPGIRARRFIKVRLAGVRNLKTAPFAEVEVKAGSRYQKRVYTGIPLAFGLGNEAPADTVRITWPNGLIQNEIRQLPGKSYRYEEAQRLSGSCPIIWTWDGEGFRYITDVLGVAPLGASSGDGTVFPVDHDEYIQIPGDALVPRDGAYEVRVTEELSEAAYLDQISLLAIDHPADTEVFTDEKFKAPPFPEFRLYQVKQRVSPRSARDDKGRDVLAQVLRKDRTYPTGFWRDLSGVAEKHHLDLDFPDTGAASLLVLHGWVDWADGSTFLAASQEGKGGLLAPYLQMKDGSGKWVTVLEDMGMPAGKPKTIAIDLTGKWLSASREIRIVTNLCVYWDEIFLSGDTAG